MGIMAVAAGVAMTAVRASFSPFWGESHCFTKINKCTELGRILCKSMES